MNFSFEVCAEVVLALRIGSLKCLLSANKVYVQGNVFPN